MGFRTAKKHSPQELRKAGRARATRAALRALRKARLAAEANGTVLSAWEGEFLVSVETRVETYGSAFRDAEKGTPGASLSRLQTQKVKEIAAKAHGEKKPGSTFRRRA